MNTAFQLKNIIGDESQFPIEHRLLNIVIISGLILAIWSSITNFVLQLDSILILTSITSCVILAVLYYLSFVKKKYSSSIRGLIIFAVIIIPVIWITNGGISSSIPFYIITFSSIGAVMFSGRQRIALIAYFIAVSIILILVDYNYPFIISSYSSTSERYIDVFIGLVTSIIFNTVIIAVILKSYLSVQKNLMYLSYHDTLTGLNNRTYFEKIVNNLEYKKGNRFGLFVIDLDGLKFINDTQGHEQGNEILRRAAKIIQSSFRTHDTIARIGGDEFIVIIQDVMPNDMENFYIRINDNIQRESEIWGEYIIPLTMSIGYAYSNGSKSISNLFPEADRKMYREKLFHKSETEGSIIQTVQKMLSERDCDTEKHSSRLQSLIEKFAIKAGLPKSNIADIKLFAEFHDVGKIGIPDRILHKAESLTAEERKQIQQHCEIGYRIAKSSNDLSPIADLILKHHEWWNGEGYPLGIMGEKIPIECRIISIADAYDAMTNDRPYRQAMSHESALEELKNMAGIQFDPELVNVFIKINF